MNITSTKWQGHLTTHEHTWDKRSPLCSQPSAAQIPLIFRVRFRQCFLACWTTHVVLELREWTSKQGLCMSCKGTSHWLHHDWCLWWIGTCCLQVWEAGRTCKEPWEQVVTASSTAPLSLSYWIWPNPSTLWTIISRPFPHWLRNILTRIGLYASNVTPSLC